MINIKPNDQSWVGTKIFNYEMGMHDHCTITYVGEYWVLMRSGYDGSEKAISIERLNEVGDLYYKCQKCGKEDFLYIDELEKYDKKNVRNIIDSIKKDCQNCEDKKEESENLEKEFIEIKSKQIKEHAQKQAKKINKILNGKKTKRLAPALVMDPVNYNFWISNRLWENYGEAKEAEGSSNVFIKWPAGEGYWVEVEE